MTLEAAIKLFVAIIVFEGAFSLEWTYLRIVSRTVRNLVTVGAAVTLQRLGRWRRITSAA